MDRVHRTFTGMEDLLLRCSRFCRKTIERYARRVNETSNFSNILETLHRELKLKLRSLLLLTTDFEAVPPVCTCWMTACQAILIGVVLHFQDSKSNCVTTKTACS